MRKCNVVFALIASAAAAFAPPAMSAQDAASPRRSADFISGGVGEDSSARMKAVGKDYNLKLLFAAKDGHYLADVAVTISDARGATVLDAVSDGPFFFARLGPGRYVVRAAYAGESIQRDTTIPASGQREVVFRWVEQSE